MDCDRDSGSSHVHDAINHLHDEDLEPEKSVKWGRRALLVILPACLLTAALVTFLIGLPAHPPDITLLDLQSDSELAKRNELEELVCHAGGWNFCWGAWGALVDVNQ
jgi:hypothetical protein